ncbi:adenylate isopentenyltransferase 3, chloroplastic [Vitis riparia]|uniref:adenylate isopentenyltransferase 3, chloroplastic n=1 Tax=Vitis riparia TaxID=96939 RepID=UPI00155AD473|nr:adenylate isopentenyltransferase 3, chloroplastic [Vitis riparia]
MQIYMHMRKQTQPLLSIPPGDLTMDVSGHRWPKGKVVVVMGATGTGKSRLSIDLATRFPAEIVNSDKMQVYEGLDIVTNKITEEEQRGVPHHLLRIAHPNVDFTASDFRDMASLSIESILGRGRLPIVVGGSNSYIEALVGDEYSKFRSRYECCFLWVDVSRPVLHSFVSKRVDKMVEKGMVEEVQQLFHPNADYTRGIRRAIGVPELDLYFRTEGFLDEEARARVLQEAVHEIKANTCKLACRQLEKIHRLKNVRKWKIHRLGATEVLRKCDREADEAWEKLVARPSTMMVAQFLYSVGATRSIATTSPPTIRAAASMEAALAATH